MSLIIASHISKTFGTKVIFDDLSFSIEPKDKIVLVGYNGTGKTTLMKILAGVEEIDNGKVEKTDNLRIGYIPQDPTLYDKVLVKDYIKEIAPDVKDHEWEQLFNSFTLPLTHFDEAFKTLSSGQKTKVFLIAALLSKPDIFLFDEPTNNLDLPSLMWLESYVKQSEAAMIIISHDRVFLDKVISKIFEIDWKTKELTMTKGRYSDFLEDKKAKRLATLKAFYEQQEELERLDELVKDKKEAGVLGNKWKSNDNDKFLWGFKRDRSKRSGREAKVLEGRIERIDKIEKPARRNVFEISLDEATSSGPKDITLSKVTYSYDSFTLQEASFDIRYGNRIAIVGDNGAGKSTLLKLMTGYISPSSGEVLIGSGIRLGNMMQEVEQVDGNISPLTYLMEQGKMTEELSYERLVSIGLSIDQIKNPINTLSPGTKAKLVLVYFDIISVNTLVLDEPTNHLDIEGQEVLEEILETFKGTIVAVSHDRYFIEKLHPDYVYEVKGGKVKKVAL